MQAINFTELVEIFPRLKEKVHIKVIFDDFLIKKQYSALVNPSCSTQTSLRIAVNTNPHQGKFFGNVEVKFRLLEINKTFIKTAGDYLQTYRYFHTNRHAVRELLECSDRIARKASENARTLFE